MEIMGRMSTRWTWLLGLIVLISTGWLVACGSHYKASSDGLVIVPSQGSGVLQAFSFNLSNGHTAQINTSPSTNGTPSAIVLDPAGAFAYVLVNQDTIATFKVNSDGTLSGVGTKGFNPASVSVPGSPTTETVSVVPAALAMDSAGKFLFVADRATTDTAGLSVSGSVSVFSIGSSASLSEVSGSPFFTSPPIAGGTVNDMTALAATPTLFPTANSACPGKSAATTEYLYVTDAHNNQVWDFAVDMSSGALGIPTGDTAFLSFPTGSVPSAVAVDPCNRFVYVANHDSNNVSGYTMCNATLLPNCQSGDGSLVSTGAPISAGTGPTALAVDPLGNFVYVVNQLSNNLSGYKISPVTGVLTSFTTIGTGGNPVSIAIRADDSWLFVTNNHSASISQFSLIPASGVLTPVAATTTDNFPWGVAVK